jgi:hypothetical protein
MDNWNFEQGLTGWTKTGTAFDHQPTYGNNISLSRGGFDGKMPLGGTYWRNVAYPIGINSNYWIGTFENRPRPQDPFGRVQGDGPTGTLTSEAFKVANNFITFLIGGGKDLQNLKIELLVSPGTNQPFRPIPGTARTGMNLELMRREWWDVRRSEESPSASALRIIPRDHGDTLTLPIFSFKILPRLKPSSILAREASHRLFATSSSRATQARRGM